MAVPTPLTTQYSIADAALSSSCFQNLYYDSAPFPVILGPGTVCLPPGPAPTSQSLSTYYSPGISCPASYTVACSSVVQAGAVTETRATCCPVPTDYLSLNSYVCQTSTAASDIALNPQFAQYGCTMLMGSRASTVPLTVTNTTTGGGISTIIVDPTQGPNAYSVQIRWQASDLAASASTTTSGQTVISNTSQAGATSSGTPSATSNASSGLSTGAKVGLAVGIIIVVASIIAFVTWFLIRRRKSQAQHSTLAEAPDTPEKHDRYGADSKTHHNASAYEVSTPQQKPVEIGSTEPHRTTTLQELPADASR